MTQEPDIMDFEEAYVKVKKANERGLTRVTREKLEENHEKTWGTPEDPISDQENRRRLWCKRELDSPRRGYKKGRGYRKDLYYGSQLGNIILQSRLSGEELAEEELENIIYEQISVLEEADRVAEQATIGVHQLDEVITPEMYLETEDYILAPRVHGADQKRLSIIGKTSVERERGMMRSSLRKGLKELRRAKEELRNSRRNYKSPIKAVRETLESVVPYSRDAISICREKIGNALRKAANRFSETEQEIPRDDDLQAYEEYWRNLKGDQE